MGSHLGSFLNRSRKAGIALAMMGLAGVLMSPMAQAQTYVGQAYAPQPAPVYYQQAYTQAPQVVYQSAPQVIYQQPAYAPVVVTAPAPYYNPLWPVAAVGLGIGAVVGGWGHGFGHGFVGHGHR